MTKSLEQSLGADASELIKLHKEINGNATSALKAAIRAGEILTAVKGSLDHGEWSEWCDKSLPFSVDTAQRYMKCFKNKVLLERAEVIDLSKAYRQISPPKKKGKQKPQCALFDGDSNNGEETPPGESPGEAPSKPSKPKPVEVVLDGDGMVIPAKAMEVWNRRGEINEMLTALSRIKGRVEKAQETKDSLYSSLNFSILVSELQHCYTLLKNALPFTICPNCQGHVLSPCSPCRSRGMVSEYTWNHGSYGEHRKLREKARALKGKK